MLGANRYRNHILGDQPSSAYASIETLFGNIHQAVIRDELKVNIGIVSQHRRQFRPQYLLDSIFIGGNAHPARRLIPPFSQLIQPLGNLFNGWANPLLPDY